MTLNEQPIRFVCDAHGTSMITIFKTIRSYGAPLRSRFDIGTTLGADA